MKTKYNTINNLLENPGDISEIMKNPSQFGMDFWNELSNTDKRNLAFAAAAGLVMYGIYLGRQDDNYTIQQ